MSRIYSDGFEAGHYGNWVPNYLSDPHAAVIDNDDLFNFDSRLAPIEYGNYAVHTKYNRYFDLDLTTIPGVPSTGLREIYVRMRMQTNHPTQSRYLELYNGTSYIMRLTNNLTSHCWYLDMYYDLYGSRPIEAYQWHLLELYVRVSSNRTATDGALEFKLNGVSQTGMLTGISTTNIATADKWVTNIRLGPTASNYSYILLWDDIVICDSTATTSFTDAHILGGEPYAIGSNNFWEPEPPSLETYECVNTVGDTAAVETNYIVALGTGGRETFPVTLDNTAVTAIDSVSVRCRSRKAGAASAYQVAPVLNVGGVNYDATPEELTVDYEDYYAMWEQNPNTGLDWDVLDINDIEVGVRSDE